MTVRKIVSASFAIGVGAAGALLTRPRRPAITTDSPQPPVHGADREDADAAADAPMTRDRGAEIPERRSGADRRSGVDRRMRRGDQALVVRRIRTAIERRAGTERRSGADRRSAR